MRLANKEIYYIRKIKEVFPGARQLTGLEAERYRISNERLKSVLADLPKKPKVGVNPLVMRQRKLKELLSVYHPEKVSNKKYRLRNQVSLFGENTKGAK